jgi:monothiol glutaredoxin
MTELREKIKQTIESEPVVVFIKGTPQQPLCGNSMRALDALRSQGAPIAAVDVLPDPQIRQELSALSSWPTIPQVFVRGELIGGADIVQELAETGELKQKLDSALGEGWQGGGEERVVSVSEESNPLRLVP